jgi:hypothetical protein
MYKKKIIDQLTKTKIWPNYLKRKRFAELTFCKDIH